MTDLEVSRRRFAEDLRETANLAANDLVEAFATVPRERFLGCGPWHVLVRADDGSVHYRITENADPIHVYRDVLIGIDPSRGLNNGEPHSLASWIDQLALKSGEKVIHVGSGTGYYTAILAELVGPAGQVDAYEIDAKLAALATDNLRDWSQVIVFAADGRIVPSGEFDAVFVNCGVTHPAPAWLTCIRTGGRLVLPVTASSNGTDIGVGAMYLITRTHAGLGARYLSGVGIFPCSGGRSDELNAKLLAKPKASWRNVRSIRTGEHDEEPSCWLHTSACCLSEAPLQMNAA